MVITHRSIADVTPSNPFDPSRSVTFNNNPVNAFQSMLDLPTPCETTCYSATLSGDIHFETFKIGDLVLNDYLFGAVYKLEPTTKPISPVSEAYYPIFSMDGVFGLGFTTWTSLKGPLPGIPSPLLRMAGQGLLGDGKLFSLYFSGDSGELVLGGTNRRRASSNPRYVPLVQSGSEQTPFITWSFLIEDIKVSFGEGDEYNNDIGYLGVLDSSSDMLYAPREFMGKFVSRLSEGDYDMKYDAILSMSAIPCVNRDRLPILNMNIGGSWEQLHGADYCRPSPSYLKRGFCRLLIAPHGSSTWVLGLPFLRKYVTVFDYGKLRIGLAHRAKNHRKHGGRETERTKKGGGGVSYGLPRTTPELTDVWNRTRDDFL